MKKTKSLLGLAVLVLSAGALVACGGGEKADESAAASACKTHKWQDKEVTKAPTCTEKGKKTQVCSVCGQTQEKDVNAAGHKYVEDTTQAVAATCEATGKKVEKCSVCNDVKESTVAATGHTAVAAANQEGAVAAKCGVAGSEKQECSVCHKALEDKVLPALEHEYGETVWTKEANCTEAGVGTKTCTRADCGHEEPVTAEALGHTIVGDDEGEPEPGYAKVRVYDCERCDVNYLGFKASEASEDSLNPEKGHLIVDEDGGAKFWGQPIGNDVVLNANGDATADDHEAVFNPLQEGNYFEYKFKLTAAEAASLGDTQLLYCEAKAANYLSGKDFWAADGGEEWTPGLYPEAVGDHEAGDIISDYRYILYVDGHPQVFDSTMTAPVTGGQTNQPKKEYVMPYKFHLHEGTNTIRLVMAGGYKSTFYNFTFRPVEAEEGGEEGGEQEQAHAHTWTAGTPVTAEGKSTYTEDSCSCGKKRINLNVVDLDGKITAKGGKLGSNGATARYAWDMPAAKTGKLWIKGTVDNASNYNYGFYTGKNGGQSAVTLPDGKTNTTITVNDAVVALPVDKTYSDLGMKGTDEAGAATFEVGAVTLGTSNTMTIKRNDSFGIQYYELFIILD